MASPQTENGYTKIANELLEAILRADLTLRETKIIFAVIRFTYGFNRKEHDLSIRFLSNATGINFQHISSSIKGLTEKDILLINASEIHSQSRVIKLNKNYELWKVNRNQISYSNQNGYSSQISYGSVTKSVTETVTKSVTKKEIKEKLNKYTVEDFEKFWLIFPNGELGNKGSKKRAQSEFMKISPDKVNFETLVAAINCQAEQKRKLKAEGKFFPQFQHVERWLKNERWTDDILSIPENQKCYEPTTNFMRELLNAEN